MSENYHGNKDSEEPMEIRNEDLFNAATAQQNRISGDSERNHQVGTIATPKRMANKKAEAGVKGYRASADSSSDRDDEVYDDDLWECDNWVEDQMGDSLDKEDPRNILELPKPEPEPFIVPSRDPLAAFRYFLNRDFFDAVAKTTNGFYTKMQANIPYETLLESWSAKGCELPKTLSRKQFRALVMKENCVTGKDIEMFFGIVLYMDIVKLPELLMYWEGSTKVEKIIKAMSFSKFDHIRSHLQVANEVDVPVNLQIDPLSKVTPLLTRFQTKCEGLPIPDTLWIEEIAISKWGNAHGSVFYCQHRHVKPSIRIFVLRSQGGIIHGFRCYSGEEALVATSTDDSTIAVVEDLISNVPQHQFYRLLFEEGFCTVGLLKQLRVSGFRATGILRNVPQECAQLFEVLKQKLPNNENSGFTGMTAKDGSVYICRWTDKKNQTVTFGSTEVKAFPLEDITRPGGSDTIVTAARPHCASYLLRHLGTPVSNRMVSTMPRRDHQLPELHLSLIYWFLGAAVRNSYLLEQRHSHMSNIVAAGCNNELQLVAYILNIAEKLMLPDKCRINNGSSSL